ncbi:ribonuclease H-like domain-containing protein, partial [Tanacetum coccineum]
VLKVPRQHNMYTFDMKTVDSSKGYTCLLAKASSDEEMPDENQVLLKVPRQHNMYTFDMKTVDSSSKGYTCLLAKASSNEAKLWHRRLGHLISA